ncbi:beta strand repeat-containing protein [Sphingomonas bacterium]|uniref:beta strand repeat-containing protein n=1 Tax=Sphingomonas bacterium TaxID=1895847 RepID=UPI001576B713|nr:filamentous hemagglutinin N-terminal domain-containing protein [Sphingomonas bacterium]
MRSAIKLSFDRRWQCLLAAACVASLAVSPCRAQRAPVLPSGEHVQSGTVTIALGSAGTLTVQQSSPTAIVSWNDFSIGAGGTVRFENGNGATLNRVTGTNTSQIDGSLLASGSVYLVNPHGVIVGKSGVVQVGGSFVASTLDIADADFLDGGNNSFAGPSRASVVNLGRIGALGGDVALFATTVRNQGNITAPAGDAALLAGSSVLMRDAALDGGRFVVLVGDKDSSVTNTGAIAAAATDLIAAGGSIYALAGNISGILQADTVTGINGRVFLTASTGGSVMIGTARITSSSPSYGGDIEISGTTIAIAAGAILDASALSIGGQINIVADQGLRFDGTARANGTDQGGLVRMAGRSLDVASARVEASGTTLGTWTIEQPSFVIDAGAAGAINRQLRTVNVEVDANQADFGEPSNGGDLIVAAPISWSSGNRLTLFAQNALHVNENVTVAGPGTLNLYAFGSDNAGPLLTFAPNRSISFTGSPTGAQALFLNDDQYTLIYNLAGLQAIGADPTGAYALARSISASATTLSGPVAGGLGSDPFSGQFDGLGHSINGLKIDAPGKSLVGLFGAVTGYLRNVNLVGGSVVGGSTVGALAAYLDGGGIERSSSSASITSRDSTPAGGIGGLVGSVYLASVDASSATGIVYAPGATGVGGLIGTGYGLSVTNSFATGAVTGGQGTGGLVGSESRSGIDASYASGAVTGTSQVGGLVGVASYGGGATNSQASGRVTGGGMVGGLIGNLLSGYMANVGASGNVSASSGRGGGLVGSVTDSDIEGASASGRVTGGAGSGGLIGAIDTSTVANATATGGVTGASDVGGLIGTSSQDRLRTVVATGAVNGTIGIGQNVGGLIGRSTTDDIAGARAANSVRGRTNVGGLIGRRSGGTLSDASATGPVSGTSHVGPLIGLEDPAS